MQKLGFEDQINHNIRTLYGPWEGHEMKSLGCIHFMSVIGGVAGGKMCFTVIENLSESIIVGQDIMSLFDFWYGTKDKQMFLGRDSNNAEAKVILETAMVKLKEIAQQQIDALTKQETQKMVEDSDLVPAIPKQ